MAEAKWSGVLSTTEPRNDVGIIKVRQGNVNSEVAEFQIVQNNKPYNLTGLTVYFCASFGLNLVEKPAVIVNAAGGRIQYTFDDDSMQSLGRQKGYFSIKKEESKIDSTQDFEYQVESSLMTRSIDGKSYIYKLSALIKILDDFVKNGQKNFNTWFESVKEILYGVDPGGNILRELIEARKNSSGNVFASLKERLDKNEDETNRQLEHTLKIFREVTVNINDFGAVYNDETFDNMAAISAAQDYLEALGGGQIYFPNAGILYIKPFLNIKSGIHLLGAPERAKMKIAPDVTNFWKVFGFEEKENVAAKNIEIDTNMENRSGYDLDISPQIIFSFAGTKNAELTNNKLIGNGVWVISAFASAEVGYSRGIKVRDNHIIWKAGHSTQKPDLPNGVQIDNTCVYFDAIDYKIEHNLIETADGLKNMTCIEAHGADAIVKDNYVKGFRTGIIAWSLVIAPESPVTENNIKVADNNFIDVENGIYAGATKGFNLIGVDLSHNTILLNPKKFGRGSSRGIELQHPTSSTTTKLSKVKIIGNTISSKEDLTSYPEPDRALNFTGIDINEGNIEKVTILENTISDIAGTGLKVGNAAGVLLKLKDSTIAHNTFVDCGKNTNIATSEFVGRSAMSIRGGGSTTLERVGLGINYIYDTRTSGTYFTRPIYTTLADEEKQVIKTAARADWFAKRSYSPVIAFDSQIGNITTKRKGTYQFDKNVCKVEFEIEVTGTSITQGYGSYITLPFDAEITENFLGGRFNLIGPENSVSGALSITTNNLKVALLQPVTTAAKFPVGTKLVGQIEYPISRVTKYEQ